MSSVPPDYVKSHSFTTLALQPITTAGLPGSQLDSEFVSIATSVNQTIDRLSEIQQDDGKLRSNVVTIGSLSPETTAAISTTGSTISGEWAAGITYHPGDIIIYGADNYAYICSFQHTASTNFESDFAAKSWAIMGYRPSTRDLVVKTFSGTGSKLDFDLEINPVSENNTQVFVSGVYKSKSTYHITGNTLWFETGNAPASGTNNIEVVIGVAAELINNVVTIPNNSVGTAAIINLNVTGAKIADLTITSGKLADQSVTSDKIENNAVGTTKITDLSITTDKLVGGSVTTPKIASGSITTATIADSAVDTTKLASGAVTSVKIGDLQVITSKIGESQVTTSKIGDSQVTTSKIGDSQVTTSKIGDSQVTTGKIANEAITSEKIGASNIPCQIVQSVMTTKLYIPANVLTTIPALTTAITRSRTSSKIRIQGSIACSTDNSSHGMAFQLFRSVGGVLTQVGKGTAASGTTLTQQIIAVGGYSGAYAIQPVTFDFIDTGTVGLTNLVSYVVKAWLCPGVTGDINTPNSPTNANYIFDPISTLTLTELT